MAGEKRPGKGYKLSSEQQTFVCACLASGHSPELVVQELQEEFDIEVTRQNIRSNYQKHPKWEKVIAKMAEEFQKEILKHPLAIKVNRLNWLLQGLNEATTWRHDKFYFDKEGVQVGKVVKKNIGVIAQLVREARAETEGEKGPEFHQPINIYLPKKDKE